MFRTLLLAAAFTIGFLSAASAATIDFRGDTEREVRGAADHLECEWRRAGDAGHRQQEAHLHDYLYRPERSGDGGPLPGPAAAGANAGVAVPIGSNPASPSTGSVTLTDAQMKDLEAGNWYANVHTEANKGGEIRGQLMRVK